ncbi:hypothetical protein VNO80_17315 [Phaseolus coccineus]|uniref:Uncharacterized protein n=1 Tax=Phaseolus coccineus TaxID=3886 RepID=A0AAN9MQ68_PHACN
MYVICMSLCDVHECHVTVTFLLDVFLMFVCMLAICMNEINNLRRDLSLFLYLLLMCNYIDVNSWCHEITYEWRSL